MDVSVRRIGTAFPQRYPDTRTVNTGLIVGSADGLLDEDAGEQDFADVLAAGQVGNQRLHL